MAFPITLTNAVDLVTDIMAAHLNSVETKIGVDGSAVVTSLDYLLKNPASIDPGHLHTAAGISGATFTVAELNFSTGVTSNIQTQLNNKVETANYLADVDPGHKHSKLWTSDGVTEMMAVTTAGFLSEFSFDVTPVSSFMALKPTFTGTLAGVKSLDGFKVIINNNVDIAGFSLNLYAVYGRVANPAGYLCNSMRGILGTAYCSHTAGAVGSAYGGQFTVTQAAGGGSITTAYGNKIDVVISGGDITTAYGIHIGTVNGTNKWCIYAADATAPSYFAGSVGFGVTVPTHPVDVRVTSSSGIRVMSTAAMGAGSGGTVALYTNAFPTAADQRIGRFVFGVYNEGTAELAEPAIVAAFSEESWVYATNRGTYLRFETLQPGTISRAEKMRLTGAGNLLLGTTSFGVGAEKVLAIGNGLAPAALADAVQLWSADTAGLADHTGLHIMTEDGTGYVFGDRIVMGSLTPDANAWMTITKPSLDMSTGASAYYALRFTATATGTLTANGALIGLSFDMTNNLTLAGFNGTIYGLYGRAVNGVGYVATNLYGALLYGFSNHTAGTTTTSTGVWGVCQQSGAGGTVTTGRAGYFGTLCTNGTITTGHGIWVYSTVSGGGAIGTMYGVYIAALQGTTKYGVYQVGTADLNFFAGFTGIGVSPDAPLNVEFSRDVTAAGSYCNIDATLTTTGAAGGTATAFGASIFLDNTATVGAGNLSCTGLQCRVNNTPGYLCTSAYGGLFAVYMTHTAGSVTAAMGGNFSLTLNGVGGTIATATAGHFAMVCSAGTITTAYGGNFSCTGAGTMTTSYGIYVGNVLGTTAWSLYVSSTTAPSYFAGNVGIGSTVFETGSTQVLVIGNGTAPDGNLANATQIYSADQVAGNACLHTRTENGAIIKLFQGAALTTQLTTITHTAPGTPDYAIQDLVNTSAYGFVTKDEGNSVLKVIANLQTRVAELETRLKAHGLLA